MSTTDAGIRQLKNGNWAYRFSISVNGQKISQRGSTNSEGQPLKTKTDAIRARKKAIKLAQLAPELPVKEKEPEKLTVAQVFEEYREKGRSDRAYCGLRINECFGLKWQNVDLQEGVIRIEQQMQYQEGLVKLVPLKTRNARRTIFMNSKVKAHFEALAAARAEAEQKHKQRREQNQTFIIDVDGSKISNLELVNTLLNGKMQTVNSMKYHSRELKSKGINFKYHFLRHTYGTQLAVLNTPTHLLCNQMGHGNIHVTERYYIALSKNGIDVLRKNLEQL